jgi:hypothetical protein
MNADLRTSGVYTIEEIEESKRWRGLMRVTVLEYTGGRMKFYRASNYTGLVKLLSSQEIIPSHTERLGLIMEETIGEYRFRAFPDIIHRDIILELSMYHFTDVVYIPHFSNLVHLTISNCGKFNFAVDNGYDFTRLRTVHIDTIPEIRSLYVAPNLINLNVRNCHVAHMNAHGDGRDLDCYKHEGVAIPHLLVFKDATFDYKVSECLDVRPNYYGYEWNVSSLHKVMETVVSKNFMQTAYNFNAFRNRTIDYLVKEYNIHPRAPVEVVPGAIFLASNPIRRALEYICLY